MIKEFQLRILPKEASDISLVKQIVCRQERIAANDVTCVKIIRRSIDARQRQVMINLKVRVWIGEKPASTSLIQPIKYPLVANKQAAIVVGAGPAGLFAALRLIELGIRPIVLERGKNVNDRLKDIAAISREGIVNPNSNYCFGEGGAGAYSDGKLYTRSKKRGNIDRILAIFHQHGASENILIDAHPHIGTDRLPKVIANMRGTIINSGGEVHFNTRVTDLIIKDNAVVGAITEDGTHFAGQVVLATGHSARDVYRMLQRQNVKLEEKGIAVGVRLEHPQHLIDQIQYHNPEGRGKYLPAAEYAFVTQVDGRGVYSFCMCPGGYIIPAASEEGQLVVNGMSPSSRGGHWANSGMVVELHPEDIPDNGEGVLKMMKFQDDLERECFKQAGNSQVAGAQRMKDFVEGKPSKLIPPSSYPPGVQPSRLDKWLPPMIANRLRKGFATFGKQARGFLTNEAIVIGVETRTSSPVRIPRDRETMAHIEIKGLYPCGEGAGYAGGIVSAAMDGEKSAEALAGV